MARRGTLRTGSTVSTANTGPPSRGITAKRPGPPPTVGVCRRATTSRRPSRSRKPPSGSGHQASIRSTACRASAGKAKRWSPLETNSTATRSRPSVPPVSRTGGSGGLGGRVRRSNRPEGRGRRVRPASPASRSRPAAPGSRLDRRSPQACRRRTGRSRGRRPKRVAAPAGRRWWRCLPPAMAPGKKAVAGRRRRPGPGGRRECQGKRGPTRTVTPSMPASPGLAGARRRRIAAAAAARRRQDRPDRRGFAPGPPRSGGGRRRRSRSGPGPAPRGSRAPRASRSMQRTKLSVRQWTVAGSAVDISMDSAPINCPGPRRVAGSAGRRPVRCSNPSKAKTARLTVSPAAQRTWPAGRISG